MKKFVLEWCYGDYSSFQSNITTIEAESEEEILTQFVSHIAKIKHLEKEFFNKVNKWSKDKIEFEIKSSIRTEAGNLRMNLTSKQRKNFNLEYQEWLKNNPQPKLVTIADKELVINGKVFKNYSLDEPPEITELNEWFEKHKNEEC